LSFHFQMKGDCSKYEFESLACISIYSPYYVMGEGGEDIYEFESLAFSSCMISSTIRSLYYLMGDGGEDIYEYESLACSMSLYYQMETDCS
jgi:hypothetical protein